MLDDGDRILDLVGVVLVVALLVGVGVLALNFDPPEEPPAPDAEWSVERVNDTYVRVTHADGQPVGAEDLRVTVDSVARDTTWTATVSQGDSTLVVAPEGTLVRVVWLGGRGNREILFNERV